MCQALNLVQEHSLPSSREHGFEQIIMSVMCVMKMNEHCTVRVQDKRTWSNWGQGRPP